MKKTHTHTHTYTHYTPNRNSQRRSSPDTHVHQQWAGAEQGGTGCMLRVRTGPECLEDKLRELTWDSSPNCGIAWEKKNKKTKKNFPGKSSEAQLGLLKEQRTEWIPEESSTAVDQPLPLPWWPRGRWVRARAGRWGAISAPEIASSTKLWAGSQLLTKSSWDPGWLTSTKRITVRDQLPRRDTQHTWDSALLVHPGNWAAETREVIRHSTHPGRVPLLSTRSLELLRPGKGTKRRPNGICAFVEYPRTWTWAAKSWEVHTNQGSL